MRALQAFAECCGPDQLDLVEIYLNCKITVQNDALFSAGLDFRHPIGGSAESAPPTRFSLYYVMNQEIATFLEASKNIIIKAYRDPRIPGHAPLIRH